MCVCYSQTTSSKCLWILCTSYDSGISIDIVLTFMKLGLVVASESNDISMVDDADFFQWHLDSVGSPVMYCAHADKRVMQNDATWNLKHGKWT